VGAREKILRAATKLFSRQGYANTPLALVAKKASVSKALVLWHFDTKENLFRCVLQSSLEPYTVDVHTLRGLSESEQVEKLVGDYCEFISDHLYSVKFILGLILREEEGSRDLVARARELYEVYRRLLVSILERGRENGTFSPGLHPERDTALILATLNGLLLQQFAGDAKRSGLQALLGRYRTLMRAHLLNSAAAPGADARALSGL